MPPLCGRYRSADERWLMLIPGTLATLACVFFARLPVALSIRREVLLLASVLLAAALVTGKLTLKALRHKRPVRTNVFRRGSFWRSLAVGLVLCYVVVLAKGANAASGFWLVALAALWIGWLVMGLAVAPRVLQTWQWLAQRHAIRRTLTAIHYTVILTVGLEVALQVHLHWLGLAWWHGATLPWVSFGGIMVDSTPSGRSVSSPLQVALLGDELTLAADADHAMVAQLHDYVPALEIQDRSQPQTGPRDYARRGLPTGHTLRPDVLLAFFSVDEDVVSMPLESDWFDWRSWELPRYAQHMMLAENLAGGSRPLSLPVAGSTVRELAVCRTPADGATERRWQVALRQLDRLHRQCQRANIELVLVVVPADFQLNAVLLESLRRQAGYEPNSLDHDLPQRRLASFAADRKLPCIDLLPHLQRCEGLVYQRGHRRWTREGSQAVAQALGGWLQSGLEPLATTNLRVVLR